MPTTIRNCILWENQANCGSTCADTESAQLLDGLGGGTIKVTYSIIQNLVPNGTYDDGTNNIQNFDADPLFIDPDNDNYRLRRCSPAIDRADSDSFPVDLLDLDIDMSNMELLVDADLARRDFDDPERANLGAGSTTYIDLGAYERGGNCGACDTLGDLNADTDVDGRDIQPFIACILTDRDEQSCDCICGDYVDIAAADVGVGLEDVPSFVLCLLGDGDCVEEQEDCETGGTRGGLQDCNDNGVYDELDIFGCDPGIDPGLCDCNGNGVPDACDIADCESEYDCGDQNSDGIPDGCQPDCNANSVPDDKDIADATSDDCDENGVPDECDADCDGNSLVDACETLTVDCNANGIPDSCDAESNDCNGNDIPDDCELSTGDCNANGYLDTCDIALPPPFNAPDCNDNDIPDACDIAGCASDPACGDCNENGIPDGCDIANAISEDTDENGIPDECEEESLFDGGGLRGGEQGSGQGASAELTEAEKWDAYFEWCLATDFSEMTHAELFSALLAKRLELGLPAGQYGPN